jgi:hypothetical protein
MAAAVGALAFSATPAAAYKLDRHVVPQPTLRYYVALSDWKKPFDRVVHAVNRAHVGVRLVKAQIPEQASIQVGRLEHKCGLPGVEGTTQTLSGGYAAIYLPRGCHGSIASIIAGHELGHALGLLHEDRRCALMNSSGTGPQGIPTDCYFGGRHYDWLRHPFRGDDLKGLRKLYRDTRPKVKLRLTSPATIPAGGAVTFKITASDREDNLSTITVDYGDGTRDKLIAGEPTPSSHSYSAAGSYRLRATARDVYGKRDRKSVTVTVT